MSMLAAQRPRVAVALVGAALAATATLAPVPAQAVAPNLPSSPLLLAGPGSVSRLGADGVLSTLNGLLGGILGGSAPVLSEDAAGNILSGQGSVLTTLAPNGSSSATTLPGVTNIVGLASGNGATYLLDEVDSATSLLKYVPGSSPVPLGSATNYAAIANDALGNVVTADKTGVIGQILASGATAPAPISTGLTTITGLAENAGTIFTLDGAAGVVKQVLAAGGATQTPTTVPSSGSGVKAVSVDPAGNLYLAVPNPLNLGDSVMELPTGGTSLVPLTLSLLPSSVTNMITYTPAVPSTTPGSGLPGTTTPGTPTAAGYPAASFRVRTTVRHVRRHHARVTASGLMAGETYTVRLRNRVVARGTASSTGTVRVTVKLPRCFHGKGAVKVTGATSTRTGSTYLKVKHAPAGCHR